MPLPTILGIESSCDDTAAAIIADGQIRSNIVSSQIIHAAYGGVIPEVASRQHHKHIIPVVDEALKAANIKKQEIDAIAFTQGPGLLGPLLVGGTFAKGMATALDVPLIAVNHMQAHIMAHFIKDPKPSFPFICLTVSGGHTQIVMVKSYFEFSLLGETIDDAAGEAFDKAAKMLGLEYPGGPRIDKLAQGGEAKYKFTTPKVAEYNYSFSGLKTAFLYFIRDQVKINPNFVAENMADICASIQERIVSYLMLKLSKAVKDYGIKRIAIAGGVSANSGLRKALIEYSKQEECEVFIPDFEYCTDNAAMIAISAHYSFLEGRFSDPSISPNPRLQLNFNE